MAVTMEMIEDAEDRLSDILTELEEAESYKSWLEQGAGGEMTEEELNIKYADVESRLYTLDREANDQEEYLEQLKEEYGI